MACAKGSFVVGLAEGVVGGRGPATGPGLPAVGAGHPRLM